MQHGRERVILPDVVRLLVPGLALLVLLQFVVSRTSLRWPAVERAVKSEPVLLYRGGFLEVPMRRARVTEGEIRQAARGSGRASLEDVEAVVLETDGTLSVLSSAPDLPDPGGDGTAGR